MKTKRKWAWLMASVAAVVLVTFVFTLWGCAPKEAPPEKAPPEKISLRFTTGYPETNASNKAAAWMMDEIEKRSGGRVKFERFYGAALTKAGEEIEALQSGLADFATPAVVAYPSKLGLFNFAYATGFSPEKLDVVADVWNDLYKRVPAFSNALEKLGLKYVAGSGLGSYEIISTKPIARLGDFKGKKIGAMGTYYPKMIEAAGATVVTVSLADTYSALDKGLIDGRLLSLDVQITYSLHEVAKHVTMAGLGARALSSLLVVSSKAWDKLPRDIQKMFIDLGPEWTRYAHKLGQAELDRAVDVYKKAGVQFYYLSEEDKRAWAALMPETPLMWIRDMEKAGISGAKEVISAYLDMGEKRGHKWPRRWKVE